MTHDAYIRDVVGLLATILPFALFASPITIFLPLIGAEKWCHRWFVYPRHNPQRRCHEEVDSACRASFQYGSCTETTYTVAPSSLGDINAPLEESRYDGTIGCPPLAMTSQVMVGRKTGPRFPTVTVGRKTAHLISTHFTSTPSFCSARFGCCTGCGMERLCA